MRTPGPFLLILGVAFLMSLAACKEEFKTSSSPGVNVVVQDLPCAEVIPEILKTCKNQNWSWRWLDQAQGILAIGPISETGQPQEPDKKIEQQVRLDITCLEPQTTRISLAIKVRRLTQEQNWQEETDPEILNAYGKRFLERLLKRP